MGAIPIPRSYEQVLSDIIDSFRASQGVQNLVVGSALLSNFEAAARSDTRNAQDIFGLLSAISLDDATGLALDRKGKDESVFRIQESPSTGLVTVFDSSFTKIQTKVFQGSPAPIVGAVTVDVSDASLFPNFGDIYIGRGTGNYEGPLHYSAKAFIGGTHWTLTLSVGTTRFHNTSESVVLSQGGNRTISPGAIVRTTQGNVSNAVSFTVLYSYTLADGETSIPSVQVVCQKPGLIGNVSKGDIREFASPPFGGAGVTNPSPFSNGRETELDDDYRERIKDVRASRQAGTSLAITTAVTGITSTDENKRVSSASLVKRLGAASALYIDDGTGYEDKVAGVAMETLVDFAIGGEDSFQTTQRPIARAFVKTANVSPYVLTTGSTLSVKVGGTTYSHTFDPLQFTSISNASAAEVVTSINSNPAIGFLARTADAGTNVVIFSKSDTNEDIGVIPAELGVDANPILAFPTGVNFTIQLYKNDVLLSKDGLSAVVKGLPFSQWNAMSSSVITDPTNLLAVTLVVAVDNTPALTYVFVDQDFINAQTGFSLLGRNSVNAWAAVINAKIPGLTAVNDAERLTLTSNAGAVSKSAVEIVGGSLVGSHLFSITKSRGVNRDYTIDRNDGQIQLNTPLIAGDKLTVGSTSSRSFVQSDTINTVTIASIGKFWFIADGEATIIPTGITPASVLTASVTLLHDWGHTMTLTGVAGTFTNVLAGDWLILWDPTLPASLLGSHRVVSATDTTVVVQRRLDTANRVGHAACALAASGTPVCKVLSTGGTAFPLGDLTTYGSFSGAIDTCSLYDPNTKLVTPAAPMNISRVWHTATLMANGKVLVVGGKSDDGTILASIEIYDPAADTWTMSGASLTTPVFNHTATLLTSGSVLIVGGDHGPGAANSFQIYDPGANTLSGVGAMVAARARHKAVKLPNDNVLVVGGYDAARAPLATAEIFSAGALTFAGTGAMHTARYGMGLALIGAAPTTVMVAGNRKGASGNTTYEIYNIGTTVWGAATALPSNMTFEDKDLVTLTNGDVVGLHGYDSVTKTTGRGFTYNGGFTTLAANPKQTDTSAKWAGQYTEIKNGTGTINNKVCAVGGAEEFPTIWGLQPTAQVEEFDEPSVTWSVPDPADTIAATLTSSGAIVVRSDVNVQEIDVPIGSQYTATTLASVINANTSDPGLSGVTLGVALIGGTATVYQTNKVRVATNTFDISGDLALVAQNTPASTFGLHTGGFKENLPGHVGAVQSHSELGTPEFKDVKVLSSSKGTVEQLVLGTSPVSLGDAFVGLRDWWRGADGTSLYKTTPFFYRKAGNNYGFRTRLQSSNPLTNSVRVAPRLEGIQKWMPLDRGYLASPFAIGPNDDLTVQVDNDVEKRYAVNMYRNLTTIGTTYAVTDSFKDGDAAGLSLAKTFGLKFDFNDFAVYMSSRAIAFSGSATKAMIFRYYRLGPEGDTARVRFGNPTAPSQPLTVSVDSSNDTTDVIIRIQSGAERVLANIHSSATKISIGQTSLTGGVETRIFVANFKIPSASRTANVDHLTLTLPPGVTNHGLQINDKVWINSTDINFASGVKTITARTNTTIDYAETAADIGATANIGTVSRDLTGEANFSGGGVVVGDFYLNGTSPYRITTVDGTGGYLIATSGDNGTFTASSTGQLLTVDSFYKIFAGSAQTTAVIAAAINALAAAANSKCPVTVFLIGDGTGTVNMSTPDSDSLSTSWFVLADGINWVKTTTPPGSTAGDYSLTFKKPITGSLSTGSDWVHEKVRIAPTTAKNVVDWLNAPTVSGLFSVCSIQASDDGKRVQIASLTPGSTAGVQVQGGLSNTLTSAVVGSPFIPGVKVISIVRSSDTVGMTGGTWTRVQNETGLPLALAFQGVGLNSWDAAGLMTFSVPITGGTPVQDKLQFEKQGNFVAISDMGTNGFSAVFDSIQGGWIRISPAASPTGGMPQVSTSNQGVYRVLRVDVSLKGGAGTVWIENPNSIEERSECTVAVYSSDTPMPGDQLVISDPVWGADNRGVWTISAVGETTAGSGDGFAHNDRLTVNIDSRTPVVQGSSAPLTFSQSTLIYPVEGKPAVFLMKIDGIFPNQDDGSFTDIRWDSPLLYSSIAASSGSVITVLDKLNFQTDPANGVDAYDYNTGLIGEANRIIYGDPADTATYPGIASDGSKINISGPLIKRIKVALVLRVRSTGVVNTDVGDRVRSAVATVINQSPIGQPIAISSIVAAAEKVVGVISVSVQSPTYGVGNDLLSVQPSEKPLVLSLEDDIQISYSGE